MCQVAGRKAGAVVKERRPVVLCNKIKQVAEEKDENGARESELTSG